MLSNCPQCRRPYVAAAGFDNCPDCTSDDQKSDRIVHSFLSRQTGGTIDEISARTRVPRERVIEMMKQGRLLIAQQDNRQCVR
jgi:hypothetical protein